MSLIQSVMTYRIKNRGQKETESEQKEKYTKEEEKKNESFSFNLPKELLMVVLDFLLSNARMIFVVEVVFECNDNLSVLR